MAATNTTTREMYVKTRRAWKNGSRVEIEFTSVNGASHDYLVTLWLDGSQADICTCPGFKRYGHCCHVDHFRLVEGLRADKARALAALVSQINAKTGKVIIKIGVPEVAASATTKPRTIETAAISGNRRDVLMPVRRSSGGALGRRNVSQEWLLGKRAS